MNNKGAKTLKQKRDKNEKEKNAPKKIQKGQKRAPKKQYKK